MKKKRLVLTAAFCAVVASGSIPALHAAFADTPAKAAANPSTAVTATGVQAASDGDGEVSDAQETTGVKAAATGVQATSDGDGEVPDAQEKADVKAPASGSASAQVQADGDKETADDQQSDGDGEVPDSTETAGK